jgi:hypothetical protein
MGLGARHRGIVELSEGVIRCVTVLGVASGALTLLSCDSSKLHPKKAARARSVLARCGGRRSARPARAAITNLSLSLSYYY